uniref:G protein-coupled receptor 35 n=1 Tax=Bos mutus grunniens TaxID=30521 RepID=A0A8C0A293_BOSMU
MGMGMGALGTPSSLLGSDPASRALPWKRFIWTGQGCQPPAALPAVFSLKLQLFQGVKGQDPRAEGAPCLQSRIWTPTLHRLPHRLSGRCEAGEPFGRTCRGVSSSGGNQRVSPGIMNSSNCSSWDANPVYYTYMGGLLALGLLLNGLALWVLCWRLPRWTETRIYMANLAVADLCLLCALPSFLYFQKQTSKDTPLCQISQAVYLLNRYMSISLVTAIAVDRYVAVRHPLRARRLRSPGRAAAVCTALWAVVLGSLVLRWFLDVQDGGFCFAVRSGRSTYTGVFSLLGFYLPLAVLVFCSLQVVTALTQRPEANPGQAEATQKASRMVLANLAVFVVCFLPFHMVLTMRVALGLQTCAIKVAMQITSRLSDANCCLDAICYYFMAKEFQEASVSTTSPRAKAHKSKDSVTMTLT